MRDKLLAYYERELTFLRQMGAEFGRKYPKIASRLLLEPNRCEDPHVERLLEGFSLLAGRIQLKLDDEFPEITQSLLNVVYPHFTRPLPSMTVVEFRADPETIRLTSPLQIPKESMLYSKPVGGEPCRFRTCYDTVVWPIRVTDAQWRTPDKLDPPLRVSGSVAVLRLELECWPGATFTDLNPKEFRFYLNGESALVNTLLELLVNNCRDIVVRNPQPKVQQGPLALPFGSLRQVGFEENEGILPYPGRSFLAYRLLQEYSVFPEKFFFFDLRYMEALRHMGLQNKAEILFLISPFERGERQEALEAGVSARTLRMGCTPAVNLFPHMAEPILLDQTHFEYPVVPDARNREALEVFSVDQVSCTSPAAGTVTQFEPFFSFRHAGAGRANATFYHITRRKPVINPEGPTELAINLVDIAGRSLQPGQDTLTIRCTCSNGDLPSRLPFGNDNGDFEIEGASAVQRIVALRKPTAAVRPELDGSLMWRLVSHLSLNYLSLVEDGREALQEILKLYEAAGSNLDQQVEGIAAVRSRRHLARVVSEHGISFVRGMRVEIEMDEEHFVGGGVFLFASVLERFLGHYVSMNSFSQLVLRTRQRREVVREWAPRAGNRILL